MAAQSEQRTAGGEVTVRTFGGGPFAQNGFLVVCTASRTGILVDPGAGTAQMLAAVEREQLRIEMVVLTHAHLDHVDGVARAKEATGAPVLLHPDDEPLYHAAPTQAQWFGVRVDPLPPIDRHLAHGDTIHFGGCELEVRHAPGHAPGHVVLVGDGFALVGDCVFAGSIGRTDLPGGDYAQLMASIRSQILTLPDETVLYTGHGPETSVGHERVSNPFLVADYGGRGFA
jgi:hydroxyacylglutathione hydrolase